MVSVSSTIVVEGIIFQVAVSSQDFYQKS